MNYFDTVLTLGTVLLMSPVVVVLGTYVVRGTKNRSTEDTDPQEGDEELDQLVCR